MFQTKLFKFLRKMSAESKKILDVLLGNLKKDEKELKADQLKNDVAYAKVRCQKELLDLEGRVSSAKTTLNNLKYNTNSSLSAIANAEENVKVAEHDLAAAKAVFEELY